MRALDRRLPPLRKDFDTVVEIRGIEGGQKGFQVVEVKEHLWSHLSERSRVPGGPLGMTRAINGWWDIESIAAFCLYGG